MRGATCVLAGLAMAIAPTVQVASAALPKNRIRYRIDVSLDPASRVLKGREEIRWGNPSFGGVAAVPMHLYLNAFSHRGTTWMRTVPEERLRLETLREIDSEPWGYIELKAVRQILPEGPQDARWTAIQPNDGNPFDRSLVEVELPVAVGPLKELVLEVEWEAKLPVPIARTGCLPDYCLVAQWFPKIGVLETRGVRHSRGEVWAARQFHGPTEFYADFADYDVTIRVPDGFTVGATGKGEEVGKGDDGLRAFRHTQRAVHDFTFVVGSNLVDHRFSHAPKGGGPEVEVRYMMTPDGLGQLERTRRSIEATLDVMGSRIAPYPYDVLTVILPPFRGRRTGGMEYPTLVTGVSGDPMWDGFPFGEVRLPELVAVHELGHQWFYGVLASNEQEEAFLDEGLNTYWEGEVMEELLGEEASFGRILGRTITIREMRTMGLRKVAADLREPIRKRPSALFYPGTWGQQIYARPALTMATAEGLFGQEVVDKIFASHYARNRFGHPDVEDFLAAAAFGGGQEVATFLREAFNQPRMPDFSIAEIKTAPWEPPLGRVGTGEAAVMITEDNREEHPEVGLDPVAKEEDGSVFVEVTDPGWVRETRQISGTITRRLAPPLRREDAPDFEPGEGFHESKVRLDGPGWDHLPVEVEFRFADGVVVRDEWDGMASWRAYRFLRKAPLLEVRVDPEAKIALDVTPENHARSVEPDKRFRADWGGWLGALAQWAIAGVSLWL
jgi:hypothetical protein